MRRASSRTAPSSAIRRARGRAPRRWLGLLAKIVEPLLVVLFPPMCAICEDLISGPGGSRRGFCRGCRTQMTLRFHQAASGVEGHRPRPEPRPGGSPSVAVWAAGLYEGTLREAVHRFKYGRREELGRALADLIWETAADGGQGGMAAHGLWTGFDLLVPVPLHPSRARARGFNQARELARHLSRLSGIPLAPAGALRRTRRTKPQSGRTVAQRRANVKRGFRVARPGVVAGRRVLIVDDVFTTGATIDACAAALLSAGARKSAGLVLARTPKKKASKPEPGP